MNAAARPGLAALAVALLVLSGCSDDKPMTASQTADGKKVVAAMTPAITAPDQGVAAEDASCIAKRFVDAAGVQKLRDNQVVTADLGYTAGTAEKSAIATDYLAAKNYCLENKVAASLAASVTTPDGLISKAKDATCVAQAFAHAVGLDRMIAGQAVDTRLAYVPGGATQDVANARAYGEAVVSCLGQEPASSKLKSVVEAGYASGVGGALAADQAGCFLGEFVNRVGVSGLYGNRFVTDRGEFSFSGQLDDVPTATTLADLILGCVDTLKTDAEATAAKDKSIDAAKLEACLKRTIPLTYLRDKYLVPRFLGQLGKAKAAETEVARRFDACVAGQK